MVRLGQIVRCVEKPDYLDGFSRDQCYVVNKVERSHGHTYIKILGDDDRAHMLLASMFRTTD